ncbi:MAG: extracellular solute-binding protein [Clostridia bacterium]|nr:extracellular solute-binding protein [Clostridia bacterium]
MKNLINKKTGAVALSAIMACAALAGCGGKDNGKLSVAIGNWPDPANEASYAAAQENETNFEKLYPDVDIVPDSYSFDSKTFNVKASGNQLPNMFNTHYTDVQQIIKAGYALDITDKMTERGYAQAMSPDLLELVSDENGRIYGIPMQSGAYAQGLYINKELFRQAGLENADGSFKIPATYEELAETAKIIKDKTGKAGFVMGTSSNCGGWYFMNIAWSYGVQFMEQDSDGKWTATFDTQEMYDALQLVYDMKWKYNVLPDNTVIDQAEQLKLYATNQAAMMISSPPQDSLVSKYGMNKDNAHVVSIPAGPKGKFSQMGGTVVMASTNTTEEQLDVIFDWLDFKGQGPEFTETAESTLRSSLEAKREANNIILPCSAFKVWVNDDRTEKENALYAEYTNVQASDYDKYFAFDGVQIKAEEPVCAQELYSVLDGVIQEIITNKDADIPALVKTAANDFQLNHLNNL